MSERGEPARRRHRLRRRRAVIGRAAVLAERRDWIAVDEERQQLRAAWAEFFRRFDVLICPITTVAAIPHDHEGTLLSRTITVNGATRPYLDQIVWAGLVTMALLPATVAPVGRTATGLPVGLQIIGPHLEDRTTIDFARRLGEVIGGYEPPPGIWCRENAFRVP